MSGPIRVALLILLASSAGVAGCKDPNPTFFFGDAGTVIVIKDAGTAIVDGAAGSQAGQGGGGNGGGGNGGGGGDVDVDAGADATGGAQ